MENRIIKFNAFNKATWEMLYNVWFDSTCQNWDNWIIFLQYTWLNDKNWKEIYEGDIIKKTNNLYIMTYDEVFARYFLDGDRWIFDIQAEYTEKEELDNFEIIWNIYQNPNLFE